jgi:hypothetical protein
MTAGIRNRLHPANLVPDVINALHPTNMANAVRATNMQGGADSALNFMAEHPYLTTYGDLSRRVRRRVLRD